MAGQWAAYPFCHGLTPLWLLSFPSFQAGSAGIQTLHGQTALETALAGGQRGPEEGRAGQSLFPMVRAESAEARQFREPALR